MCSGSRKQDAVATATALTARSIRDAVQRFVAAKIPTGKSSRNSGTHNRSGFHEIIVAGGGARNATLVAMLAEQLVPLGIVVHFSDEYGLPTEAKEALAFAVLAYETWNRRASNVPSATGAARPAILGKISYA
jgi:anhydro-N-acetylmuramic acid kinase